VRQALLVDEAQDRLRKRDAGADEDRKHDRQPGEALSANALQKEGDPERDRGQRVAEVVDQVGEEGDAAAQRVDDDLHHRGYQQYCKARRDGLHPGARAHLESVRMAATHVTTCEPG
jgi:hypothetical protein